MFDLTVDTKLWSVRMSNKLSFYRICLLSKSYFCLINTFTGNLITTRLYTFFIDKILLLECYFIL
jgi:hypothetical protein